MSNKKKGIKNFLSGKSFYVILALCLVAIGAARFLADPPHHNAIDEKNNSEIQQPSEYTDPGILYNSNTEPESAVQQIIQSEPYSSDTKPTEANAPKVAAEKFIMPVKNGQIAKNYDEKTLQHSETYGDFRIHLGTDILADRGSDILACSSGTVKNVYSDDKLGRIVEIDHGNGIVIKYCGFSDDITVKENEKVTSGFKLGTLSGVPSESADAPHIHIEVSKSGKKVDPVKILKLS